MARLGKTAHVRDVLADLEKRLLRQLMGVEKGGRRPQGCKEHPVVGARDGPEASFGPSWDAPPSIEQKAPADRRDQPAGEQGHEEPPTPGIGGGKKGGADGWEIMPKR